MTASQRRVTILTLVLGTITLGASERPRIGIGLRRIGRIWTGDADVTKKEIVKTISDEIGLTQLKTKEIVQKTFNAIVETLIRERRIELRNFGVFEVKKRKARKARNPKTSESVFVPPKFVVTFKPGKEMEERVRNLDAGAEADDGSASNGQEAHPRPRLAAGTTGGGGNRPARLHKGP